MSDKKVTHSITNLTGASLAVIENDIEYLLFVDNEKLFPMTEYAKLQPIIADLAKLVLVHADAAAKKMQDDTVFDIAKHLKEEVGNVVYKSKKPVTETLVMTDSKLEVKSVEPHNDW